MICGDCLYRKNCQFLGKHKKPVVVEGCTAFVNEADFIAKHTSEAIKEFAERGKWIFKNSPYEMLDIAFKRLFPAVKYTAFFEPNIRDSENGQKVCGLTDFADDGEITIFIDTDLSINNSVEIFAHELAHAAVGIGHDHDEVWENAFDSLFEEYNKIGGEMFSSNIESPRGKDYSNVLKEMTEGV